MENGLKIAVAAIGMWACVAKSYAATYYVDRSIGNDNNTTMQAQSQSTPWLTIAKCVDTINTGGAPGDTCIVKAGNYPEQWTVSRSGASGSPITIKNYPGDRPHINMSGYTVSTNQIQVYSGSLTAPVSYVVIEGFEISGAYFAIHITGADNLTIAGNVIHDSGQGLLGHGFRMLVVDNIIYHNGHFAECQAGTAPCNQDHGIYMTGSDVKIINNLIYDNLAYGIVVAGYGYVAGQSPSPDYNGATGWLIANNVIAYQNYRDAIVMWSGQQPNSLGGPVQNNVIANNIFYANAHLVPSAPANGIDWDAGSFGGGNIVENNISYGIAPGPTGFMAGDTLGVQYTMSGNCPSTISANCGSNPNMVNAPATLPASPDFHLTSGSIALAFGLNLYSQGVTTDFTAITPRPLPPMSFDTGAYQLSNTTGGPIAGVPTGPTGLKWQ